MCLRYLVLGIALTFFNTLHADIIKFKDGTELYGDIIAETNDVLILKIVDVGTERISQSNILEIVREKGLRNKKKKPEFNTAGIPSLEDLQTNRDLWLKKYQVRNTSAAKELFIAQKAVRTKNNKVLYRWILAWADKGRSGMGLKDIDVTNKVLKTCYHVIKKDIDRLSRGGLSYARSQRDRESCSKCGGKGKIESKKQIYSFGKSKNVKKKTKILSRQCHICKGKKYVPSKQFLASQKRIKRLGGIDRLIKLEVMIGDYNTIVRPVKYIADNPSASERQLLGAVGRLHAGGYYFMVLELLGRIPGDE